MGDVGNRSSATIERRPVANAVGQNELVGKALADDRQKRLQDVKRQTPNPGRQHLHYKGNPGHRSETTSTGAPAGQHCRPQQIRNNPNSVSRGSGIQDSMLAVAITDSPSELPFAKIIIKNQLKFSNKMLAT